MIQRFERASLPSTRTVPAAAIERAMPAAGSTLALPRGEIAGDLRVSDRVGKRRRAIYELLIANNTASPIATFAYALEGRSQTRVTWDAIIVPAHSAVAVDIDVALPAKGRPPRMIAEVYTHDSKLVLDARSQEGIGRGLARRAIATVAGLAVVMTGSLAYASMRPQIAALAAPQTVPSGTSFDVAYSAKGASADYSVETPDGKEIAAGPLDPHANSFSVALPRADVSLGYDVRVDATGPLGNDVRSVHVVALAPVAQQPVAQIRARLPRVNVTHVALDSDSVASGQPIVVSYRSTVADGTVRLIDQYGTVRGEALLSPHGRSTLVAPPVDADQDLRVVVSAQSGNYHAASAVPVTIRHVDALGSAALANQGATVPALAPATATQASPEDAAAATAQAASAVTKDPKAAVAVNEAAEPVVATPGPPIAVDALQSAGQPIRVHILRHDAGLHLAMMGPDGDELVSEDVAAGTSTVLLQAPSEISKSGKGYSIIATFSRGVAQETLIRSIAFAK